MSISQETSIVLKGIAILFVVTGHLGVIPRGGAMGVSIFLALSGYGLTRRWNKNGKDRFWKNRIKTVWFPYFVWTAFLIILCLIFHYPKIYSMSALDYLLTLLGINSKPILDPTMWYIPYIFLCYSIFYFVFSCMKKRVARTIGITAFSIVGGV